MSTLSSLDDEQLLHHAQIDFDPLTGTALEAELLKRFENFVAMSWPLATLSKFDIDDADELKTQLDKAAALDERNFSNVNEMFDLLRAADIDTVAELTQQLDLAAVCEDFDIDDPATLRKQLDRITQLDQALQDLAEPIKNLLNLTTEGAN